jgi:hypothetical protein
MLIMEADGLCQLLYVFEIQWILAEVGCKFNEQKWTKNWANGTIS